MVEKPHHFQYVGPDGTTFQGPLKGGRCAVHRCEVYVDIGRPMCADHTKRWFGVEVADQGGGLGMGLRTTRKIPQFTMVCPYSGDQVSEAELRRRYGHGTAPYGLASGGVVYDAALNRFIGSLANTEWDHEKERVATAQCNAGLVQWTNTNGGAEQRRQLPAFLAKHPVWIQALREIEKGEWITVDYGPEYKMDSYHATITGKVMRQQKKATAAFKRSKRKR
jgi:hypothetical protein